MSDQEDIHLSEYDVEWAKNPSITDGVAIRRMVSLMIAQAAVEHRNLSRLGIITNGKVNPSSHADGRLNRRASGYKHVFEVEELIGFFANEVCAEWVGAAKLDIDPSMIKERL